MKKREEVAEIQLKFGKGKVPFTVPDTICEPPISEPATVIERASFTQGLERLLAEREFRSIAIVVADKTRLCGYDRILPWVTELLETKGLESDHIVFYIAYGTHPRQTDDESLAAYGETYQKYHFVHHDCHDADAFEKLGRTSRGTPVNVRADVLAADLILTIGAISHHYFAGYGGGRKLIFPGVAEKEAIYANHRLFLDREKNELARGCWPGNLEGNPLAEDLKEVHDFLPEYSSIHAILDSKGRPAKYFFGSSYDEFLSVSRELDWYYRADVAEQFDLVIASAGGYPKDINMIQSHKAIHNSANLVKDGGTLVVLAECVDGIGSKTFLPYFQMGGWEKTFEALVENYAGNGGTALAMMEKTSRIRIVLLTSLSAELCHEIGVECCSREEVQTLIDGCEGRVGCISNASLLVTQRFTG